MLVVMTGLPGTGKTAVAEAMARALRAPVFSVDPLEAVLLRAGVDREHRSDYAAYDLAATLAASQLRIGQSAVVDAVNAWERLRRWFLDLAEPVESQAVLIETICSDRRLHRRRFESRDRAIEGWIYEPTWQDVEHRMVEYEFGTPRTRRRRSAGGKHADGDRIRDEALVMPACRYPFACCLAAASFWR
jgi:predicted kinase